MKKRKFLSEFGVNIRSLSTMFMPADQLHSDGTMKELDEEISKKCHIYLITKRPSTYFIKDSLTYINGNLEVTVGYKIRGEEFTYVHKGKFELLDGATSIEISPYPHRDLITFDSKGNPVRKLPAGIVSVKKIDELEVLYVGQAFGDGSRTARERLKNHSTLQKILADTAYTNPDSEISVVMVQFEQYHLISTVGGQSSELISGKENDERFYAIVDNPLSEKKQIGLVEASLIRYFQPHYNDKFKIKFPSPKVKLLKKCFELDFSGLIVEINTQDIGFKLYSERVKSKDHHMANIDIVSKKSRASFFYVSMGGTDVALWDGLIS
ncbi:hypothetical protein HJ124_23595 [Vibrio parahaemolyticus]|nr:hypothetical protein [Vibrio parahaemolyticus]